MGKKPKAKRSKYTPAEYFIAFLGLALIAFVVGIIATSGSCQVKPAPDIGLRPAAPATPRS